MSLSVGIRAAALVVGLGIPAFVTNSLYRQHGQELRAAEVNTANTTRALEQHAARTVETVDTYLQAVISLIGSRPDDIAPETVHKALRDKLARSQHLTNILILSADGDVVHEAAAFPARPMALSDRDYLRTLKADPTLGLFVGEPTLGRQTHLPILPIARRINHADGAFAGVIVATLKPSAFQSVFDSFDLGPGATLGLWRSDATLLVRSPHVPALIGQNYGTGENYRRHVTPRDTRPFWSAGSTDGVERVLALGFVPSYPLYVSATQSRETALAGWHEAAWTQGGIAGGLTLVVVVALLALGRELTRRQRSEQSLKQYEALHRLLSENSSDLVAVQRTFESERSYVSPSSCRVVGWTPEEFAVLPVSAYVHPDDFERVRDEYASVVSGAPVVHSVHRVRHKAGHWIWAEATFALVGAGTDEERVIDTWRDITARRWAEEALQDSEARYRLLAEASTDMIVLADLDSRRSYVSPASRQLLGYEPEELVGSGMEEIVHPDDAAGLAGVVATMRDGVNERATSTHRLRHKDGTYVWVETQCRVIHRMPDSPPSGYIEVVRDVSERHRQAEELRAAKDAAEDAAAAKGAFLASMSHELRTPLNSIIGFSRLMAEDGGMARRAMQRYACLVRDASTTLLSIVNDVLDVSKLEAGGFELDPRPFSPRDLIEGSGALLRGLADEKGLALHVETDPTVPYALVGDEARLRQILLNLLSNAVKFTPKGMVWLFVDCEGKAEGLARIRFTVMDTGIGIPTDKRHRLFERFSQVDSSTARRFGGTGLGLSICKSLIEMMGGSVEVESIEGEGSTFSFVLDLPVCETAAAKPEPAAPVALGEEGGGARILLAEDVAMNQELAVAMLTRWGHTVDVVADGAAAVDAVMGIPYDVVLMDVQMPVMDGLEAMRRIRRLGGAFATVPILAMTANVMARDVERCRAAGADDHIGKPFVPETLRAAVARWAGATRVRPRADAGGPARPPDHDGPALAKLQGLLGPGPVAAMLEEFVAELDRRMRDEPCDAAGWDTIRHDAHALLSAAALLGFTRLSEECRALERVCTAAPFDAQDAQAHLRRVREGIARAKAACRAMIPPLAAPHAA